MKPALGLGWRSLAAPITHVSAPGPAPLVAVGLFFAGAGAAVGAYSLGTAAKTRRTATVGLGIVSASCFVVATAIPFFIRPAPSFVRPSTTARLEILSPRAGDLFTGSPARIPVALRLTGGRIVPLTSSHLIANAGHIHLSLDGTLVSMTGSEGQVRASPGRHVLQAEFVAVDHGPFHPRVIATVTFRVGL
jgi:hypothetical protein